MYKFDFENLFILDMANNHQGSAEHGKNIIGSHSEIVNRLGLRAGIKFQFRDLPNFVHMDEQKTSSNKHVPRFLSTKLAWDDYSKLVSEVKRVGLLSICTPFDEFSVQKIVELNFDLIKIASCSAADWPLVEAVADSGLPIIASTGGLEISQIDELVSFLRHRACDFALMHCVSIYPTPIEDCNLSSISTLKRRYKDIPIGWSTHEDQDDEMPISVARALGAKLFERHIGLEAPDIRLNAYSSTPKQAEKWYHSYLKTETLLGIPDRSNIKVEEKDAISGLKRGVFLKSDMSSGSTVETDDIYFAFPYVTGQVSSGEFKEGGELTSDVRKNSPLMPNNYQVVKTDFDLALRTLKKAIHQVKGFLNEAGIVLNHDFQTEYSHHYGVEKFFEWGAVLITIINRAYAKKLLVQLKGQKHPLHMHKLKEETFLVVTGELNIELDGIEKILRPGEQLTVPAGVWHRFTTNTGVIFEEISTTAHKDDSYYRDNKISELNSKQRKTVVDHWGRFTISEQLLNYDYL